MLPLPEITTGPILFDSFFKVRRDRLHIPQHSFSFDYYVLMMRGPCVVILAVDEHNRLILNEEYRHPTKQVLLCAAGGYLEENEDPLIGAARELKEECGYVAERYLLMARAYPYPGISDQLAYFVLAIGARPIASANREPSETIRTVILSLDEVNKRLLSDTACDSMLSSALYYYSILNNRLCD